MRTRDIMLPLKCTLSASGVTGALFFGTRALLLSSYTHTYGACTCKKEAINPVDPVFVLVIMSSSLSRVSRAKVSLRIFRGFFASAFEKIALVQSLCMPRSSQSFCPYSLTTRRALLLFFVSPPPVAPPPRLKSLGKHPNLKVTNVKTCDLCAHLR